MAKTAAVDQMPEKTGDDALKAKSKKAQRARNIAIALSLAAFCVILYIATWAKLGANILDRPL